MNDNLQLFLFKSNHTSLNMDKTIPNFGDITKLKIILILKPL